MRLLALNFALYLMFLTGVALFWRPAPTVLAFTAVDWAQQYEKQHTPVRGSGHTAFARELLRKTDMVRPLTAFIQQSIGDTGTRTSNVQWDSWYQDNVLPGKTDTAGTLYMSLENPLAADAHHREGYVILERHDLATFAYTRLKPDDQYRKNIPAELHYPDRMIAGALVSVVVCLLFFVQRTGREVLQTSSGKGTRFFLFLLCCGLVGVILPWFYGLTGSNVFGIIYLAGFVLLFGVVGTILFGRELLMVHGLLQGNGLLAHWSLNELEWQTFSKWSYGQSKRMTYGGLKLVTIMVIIISVAFCLLVRNEDAAITVAIVIAAVVFLWLLVSVVLLLKKNKKQQGGGEVYIGEKILCINGLVVSWGSWGARVESVDLSEEPAPVIKLVVSTLMMAGTILYFFRQHYTYFIPVPNDRLQEAAKIVAELKKNRSQGGKT